MSADKNTKMPKEKKTKMPKGKKTKKPRATSPDKIIRRGTPEKIVASIVISDSPVKKRKRKSKKSKKKTVETDKPSEEPPVKSPVKAPKQAQEITPEKSPESPLGLTDSDAEHLTIDECPTSPPPDKTPPRKAKRKFALDVTDDNTDSEDEQPRKKKRKRSNNRRKKNEPAKPFMRQPSKENWVKFDALARNFMIQAFTVFNQDGWKVGEKVGDEFHRIGCMLKYGEWRHVVKQYMDAKARSVQARKPESKPE